MKRKKEKAKEIVFKNLSGILYSFFGITFLIITFSGIHFIPDYFKISKLIPDGVSDFFGIIIGATSSILGIVVSVILIRFEIIRQRFGRKFIHLFLSNVWFKLLVNLLVITTLWSFFAFLSSNSLPLEVLTTHIYCSSFLFISSVCLLFPASTRILLSSVTPIKIQDELDKIDDDFIRKLYPEKYDHVSKSYTLFKIDDGTPVDTLRLLAKTYLNENDINVIKILLIKTAEHLIQLIGISDIRHNKNFPKEYSERLLIGKRIKTISVIWEEIVNEAIKDENIEVLNLLWDVFYKIHVHFATNKMYILHLERLEDFEREFIELLQHRKLSTVLAEGVSFKERKIKLHLEHNCPEQNLLSDFFPYSERNESSFKHDTNENVEWEKIKELQYSIGSLLHNAIENEDEYLISQCFYSLQSVVWDLMSAIKNIGQQQRRALVVDIYRNQTYYALEYVKTNRFSNVLSYFPQMFNEGTGWFVKFEKDYYQDVLSIFSDFVIHLNTNHRLPLYRNHLNNFAAIARHCCDDISSNKHCKEACMFIIKTFVYIKSFFESDLTNYRPQYKQLRSSIESIKDFHIREDKTKDSDFIQYCDSVLSKFIDFGEGDNDTGIGMINWD